MSPGEMACFYSRCGDAAEMEGFPSTLPYRMGKLASLPFPSLLKALLVDACFPSELSNLSPPQYAKANSVRAEKRREMEKLGRREGRSLESGRRREAKKGST